MRLKSFTGFAESPITCTALAKIGVTEVPQSKTSAEMIMFSLRGVCGFFLSFIPRSGVTGEMAKNMSLPERNVVPVNRGVFLSTIPIIMPLGLAVRLFFFSFTFTLSPWMASRSWCLPTKISGSSSGMSTNPNPFWVTCRMPSNVMRWFFFLFIKVNLLCVCEWFRPPAHFLLPDRKKVEL